MMVVMEQDCLRVAVGWIGVAWKAGRGLRSMDDERVVRNYRNLGETTVDNLGDGETTVTSTSPVVQ